MIENKFNIAIVGAGIVGLAIAEKLSQFYNNIIVIDKEQTFGQKNPAKTFIPSSAFS